MAESVQTSLPTAVQLLDREARAPLRVKVETTVVGSPSLMVRDRPRLAMFEELVVLPV